MHNILVLKGLGLVLILLHRLAKIDPFEGLTLPLGSNFACEVTTPSPRSILEIKNKNKLKLINFISSLYIDKESN
jgi:hypothetical protein